MTSDLPQRDLRRRSGGEQFLGRSLTALGDGSQIQRISGTLRWQSCDDDTCHLPRTERFTIEIPATGHDRPEAEPLDPNGMDVATHLTKMIARRTDKSLLEVMIDVAGTDD